MKQVVSHSRVINGLYSVALKDTVLAKFIARG